VPETVFLCGEAAKPGSSRAVKRLALTGPDANIDLRLEDIGRRMVATLPDILVDLLEVAAYVYCADQLVSRGGPTARKLGAEWRRDLRFVIPVRAPDRWSSSEVSGSLERLLSFMSEETMRFEFVRAKDPPSPSNYFDYRADEGQADSAAADEVILFSGGLDSLAGAVDRLCSGSSRVLLVSHRSSTKIAERQNYLAREFAKRYRDRVLHVPVQINKHTTRAVESTQRTRSFLFGSVAAVVARVAGTNRLALFENGIVSINLPIATQIVGAAATRTTHPRVMRDLAGFLSALLNQELIIENPFLWKTKTEVAALLRESGHADLARHTVSCSRVHRMSRLHTHCGCCSQCLDRRFGTLAAGLVDDDPPEMYETDLLTGPRDGDDRTMAEAYVRHGLELQTLTDRGFMSRFGVEVARVVASAPNMSADAAARAMIDLHRRQSIALVSVLEGGYRQHAPQLAKQLLPQSCILRLVAGSQGLSMPSTVASGLEHRPTDSRDFTRTSQIRLALDVPKKRILIEALPPIEGEVTFEFVRKLVSIYDTDSAARLAPENHTFLDAGSLCGELGMADATLRRCVYRLRRRVADAFQSIAGLAVSADALIESAKWRGYRLNPAVLLVAANQIKVTT
jgi:7-cyano-7-deazaguanine synthase in queuosine biosynthesis